MSNLNIAKVTISTRTDITLQRCVKQLKAITTCSAYTLGCGYDNSTIKLIGEKYCPITMRSAELCLHKKTFHSLGGSDNQCSHCASVSHVRNNPFEDQTSSFFLWFAQGVHVFEESPKSVQDVIGVVYCHGKYCFN